MEEVSREKGVSYVIKRARSRRSDRSDRGVCGFKMLAKTDAPDVEFSALGTEISHLLYHQ